MSELQINTTITFQNAWDSKTKIQLHQGSARSGKSFALLQFLIVKALQNDGLLISVVRKTFPALRTSAIRDFKEILRGLDLWDEEKWMATEHTYTFDNGSVIEFFSTDSAEKLKGLRRDILWIDEANELTYEQMYNLIDEFLCRYKIHTDILNDIIRLNNRRFLTRGKKPSQNLD